MFKSIIIPVYNQSHFTKQCLTDLSYLDSTNEIIVVNNASTDNTIEVLNKFPVRVINNEKNLGFAKACNFDITSLELSKTRLKSENYSNVNIIKNLNTKKKFDVIYSEQTLEHLENPSKIINTFLKILKKKGIIILKFPTSLGFKLKLMI